MPIYVIEIELSWHFISNAISEWLLQIMAPTTYHYQLVTLFLKCKKDLLQKNNKKIHMGKLPRSICIIQ